MKRTCLFEGGLGLLRDIFCHHVGLAQVRGRTHVKQFDEALCGYPISLKPVLVQLSRNMFLGSPTNPTQKHQLPSDRPTETTILFGFFAASEMPHAQPVKSKEDGTASLDWHMVSVWPS